MTHNSLAYVLGGGEGKRLMPLTGERAKPAVPFAANYRIIDFVLSNLYHSGIRKICILTQHESRSLHNHIRYGWYRRFGMGTDEFIVTLPARQSSLETGGWYRGTADAVAKNSDFIDPDTLDVVNVFGGDHVYLMDVSAMNDSHFERGADLTISVIPVKKELAARKYGVIVVDENWRVKAFEEKPENPTPMPGREGWCLASMGNYSFKPKVLLEELVRDSRKTTAKRDAVSENPEALSSYDFGFDIIPSMLKARRNVFAYNFLQNSVKGAHESERGYWKDIGDLDQFYDSNMEIRAVIPPINLYNPKWPIHTNVVSDQPAKFVGTGKNVRILDSIVANGVIVSNAHVESCVLGYGVRIDMAYIENSILFGNIIVRRRAKIKRAIIDEGVVIPEGESVGVDREKDVARGFTISENGVTVVPRSFKF